MKKSKKGAGYVAATVVAALFALIAVAVFTVTIYARSQNKEVSFFGYSFAIVVTDSMTPEIKTGSLIIVKNAEISADLVGENVVFVCLSGTLSGERIVHKAIESVEENGEVYLKTQGVKEGLEPDADLVSADNFVGVCVYSSYALGCVVSFISNYGFPLLVAVVAVPIIINQILKIIKYAKQNDGDESKKEDDEK